MKRRRERVLNVRENILELYNFCQNDINYDNNRTALIRKQTYKGSYGAGAGGTPASPTSSAASLSLRNLV